MLSHPIYFNICDSYCFNLCAHFFVQLAFATWTLSTHSMLPWGGSRKGRGGDCTKSGDDFGLILHRPRKQMVEAPPRKGRGIAGVVSSSSFLYKCGSLWWPLLCLRGYYLLFLSFMPLRSNWPCLLSICVCVRVCVCVCVYVSCSVMSNLWDSMDWAHEAPLSMGFSRRESWSGLPFPPPGDLPNPGIEPLSLMSLALAGGFFTASTTWEALRTWLCLSCCRYTERRISYMRMHACSRGYR